MQKSQLKKISEEILKSSADIPNDAGKRLKLISKIKSDIDFLNEELGSALEKNIKNRDLAFDKLEDTTFLEHYVVRALRTLPELESQLNVLESYLKMKIDFLKKRED